MKPYSNSILAALAFTAALLSFSNASFAGPGPGGTIDVTGILAHFFDDGVTIPTLHRGEVMCNVNTSPVLYNGGTYPAGTLIRLRRFIDSVQVGPIEYHFALDDGFGNGKALALVLMDCRAAAEGLCEINRNPLPPFETPFHVSTSRVSGNLFPTPENYNCQ